MIKANSDSLKEYLKTKGAEPKQPQGSAPPIQDGDQPQPQNQIMQPPEPVKQLHNIRDGSNAANDIMKNIADILNSDVVKMIVGRGEKKAQRLKQGDNYGQQPQVAGGNPKPQAAQPQQTAEERMWQTYGITTTLLDHAISQKSNASCKELLDQLQSDEGRQMFMSMFKHARADADDKNGADSQAVEQSDSQEVEKSTDDQEDREDQEDQEGQE